MKEGEKCKKGPDPWALAHLVSLKAGGSSRALAQRRSALEGVWGSLRWPTPSYGAQGATESRPCPGAPSIAASCTGPPFLESS